jgi:hypothetical protein
MKNFYLLPILLFCMCQNGIADPIRSTFETDYYKNIYIQEVGKTFNIKSNIYTDIYPNETLTTKVYYWEDRGFIYSDWNELGRIVSSIQNGKNLQITMFTKQKGILAPNLDDNAFGSISATFNGSRLVGKIAMANSPYVEIQHFNIGKSSAKYFPSNFFMYLEDFNFYDSYNKYFIAIKWWDDCLLMTIHNAVGAPAGWEHGLRYEKIFCSKYLEDEYIMKTYNN